MKDIIAIIGVGVVRWIITRWADYLDRKQLPPNWKPGAQDIDDFLSEVDAATPEAVKAKARQELGLPPKDETVS